MVAISSKNKETSTSEKGKKISLKTFKEKYLTREDQFKYEWVNGYVEKTRRTMSENQLFIVRNLLFLFFKVQAKHNIQGLLSPEIDTTFSGSHRRPDLAFFTDDQINAARENKEHLPPQFVIEIISNTDQAKAVNKKMKNYRDSKVPIIWKIFPGEKEVHIIKGKKCQICTDKDLCSADPVIKDFTLTVNEVFK